MIKVVCYKNKDNHYLAFEAKGHANYAEDNGPDIICAAITALSTSLIGALHDILKLKLDYKLDEGHIEAKITDFRKLSSVELEDREEIVKQSDLLFSSYQLACEQISKSYGHKYVKVKIALI